MSSSSPRATALGHGARVQGDLHLDHDAVLAGEITGRVVSSGHVELAADAVIHGDLHAASLTLAGRVAGHVVVQRTTELLPGGTIQGRLDTGHLVVVEGATYEGQLRLRRPADTSATRGSTQAHAPTITLNRTPSPNADDPTQRAKNDPDALAFKPIPGTLNAGLRPRHRAASVSAG